MKNKKTVYHFAREILRPRKNITMLLWLLILASEIAMLLTPLFFGNLIDVLKSGSPRDDINIIILYVGVNMAAIALLSHMKSMVHIKYYDFHNEVDFNILSLKSIMKFSVGQLNANNSGEIQSIVQSGLSSFSQYIKTILFDILPTLVYIAITLIWLSQISIEIMFVSLFFSIVVIAHLFYLNKKMKNEFFTIESKKQKNNSFKIEIIKNIPFIKFLNFDDNIIITFKEESNVLKNEKISIWKKYINLSHITEILYVAIMLSVLFFGTNAVQNGVYSAGKFIMMFSWISSILNRSSGLRYSFKKIMMVKPSIEKLIDVISRKILVKENGDIHRVSYGAISVKNLSFSYVGEKSSPTEFNILRNLNFELKPGESLALVGASGSGKSTLVNLIMRSHEVQKGGIYIDNIPLDKYSSRFKDYISYIEQKPRFFDRSVRFNVTFGIKRNISDNEIFDALKSVGLYDKIISFSDGLDFQIGEAGRNFSGGEIQRLAIASMLLRKSKIMILDEATSALDELSQKKVQNAIETASSNVTSIIIAHRLTTVSHCDKVLVLDKGEVEFFGLYKEAVKKSVIFRKMLSESSQRLHIA